MDCIRARRTLALAFSLTASMAAIETARAQQQTEITLETITVTGEAITQTEPDETEAETEENAWGPVDGYSATRSATGIKTDTPLKEIPQSVSVVGREAMEDQGASTVEDTLKYVPGVFTEAYGLDSRGDWARIRGGDPVEYLDGMRRLFGNYNNTRLDPYTLERVEVLKGPASMLYGQGSTAGILNLVSKRPHEEARREVGIQYGSFDRAQIQADATGKLTQDGRLLYRLVGVTRDSGTQVDFVDDDRYVFAPSLTWKPDADTSLTLLANLQKDETGSTTAFSPWEGTLFAGPNGKIPWSRFVSEPDFDAYDSESASIAALFEKRLNDVWTLRQNVRYVESSVNYQTLYPDVYTNPQNPFVDADRRKVNRYIYVNRPDAQIFTSDTSAEAELDTGPVEHKFLAGFDYTRFDEQTVSGVGYLTTPFDLYDPEYGNYTPPALSPDPDTSPRQIGFYLQDQIRYGPWVTVLGMRRDNVVDETEGAADEKSKATSYRAGLMYEFANGLTPYVSYTESFTPVSGTDFHNEPFDPREGTQWEAGFKFQPQGQDILINAALYDIIETNRLASDPDHPTEQIQIGEARFRGGEIEAIFGVRDDLDVIAGYAYTDAKITKGDNAGFHVETVPEHQASLWANYHFSLFGKDGFSLGGGVRYVGESWDGIDNLKTPSHTLFDAMFAYETERWKFQVNAINLADKKYLTTCLARGDCFLGKRRTILSNLTYKF
jgi:iron complex outermembrane receptor protein